MFRSYWGVSLAVIAVGVPFKAAHHKHVHKIHRHGCAPAATRTRCIKHADAHYLRRLRRERRARIAREERRAREAARSMSALERCIISHESGGNPDAVNGQYEGIGQWEPSRWASDGGTRFAPTPLEATYAEQEIILRGEGEAGMRQQQAQYDGC